MNKLMTEQLNNITLDRLAALYGMQAHYQALLFDCETLEEGIMYKEQLDQIESIMKLLGIDATLGLNTLQKAYCRSKCNEYLK